MKIPFLLYLKYQSFSLIPATAATVERAHSAMSEDCMNALMLLYIHKDLYLSYDQVIDDFDRRNPRKMLLVNPLG